MIIARTVGYAVFYVLGWLLWALGALLIVLALVQWSNGEPAQQITSIGIFAGVVFAGGALSRLAARWLKAME